MTLKEARAILADPAQEVSFRQFMRDNPPTVDLSQHEFHAAALIVEDADMGAAWHRGIREGIV